MGKIMGIIFGVGLWAMVQVLDDNEKLSTLNSNLQMRQEALEEEITTLKFENKYLKSDLEVGELICTGKQNNE